MISAFNLFGRECISPREKQILEAARVTAIDAYDRKDKSPWKEAFLEHEGKLTMEDVENYIIDAVKEREKNRKSSGNYQITSSN